jgi:hypothetical protein
MMLDRDDNDLDVLELRALHTQQTPQWRSRFTRAIERLARDLERMSRLCAAEDPESWSTACHESGHCLVSYLCSCDVRQVGILGHGRIAGRVISFEGIMRNPIERMMGIIAGPVSEHLLAGERLRLAGSDKTKLIDLAATIDNSFTFAAGLQRSRVYCEIEKWARNFVVENRRRILLLATLLYEFKILGAAAIDEIMDTPISEVP